MNDLTLAGCTPTPLAHYLKALAILRLVSDQVDSTARGAWAGEKFVLRSRLAAGDLVDFFLTSYSPSSVVAPWNGGSGFNPNDNKTAIDAITAGIADRLEAYRATISGARAVMAELGIDQKVDKSAKDTLLAACRARLPDDALDWLDAAFILTQEGPKYPPLLGTGGNDGRLDFTNNFMQRVVDVIDPDRGEPTVQSASWLGNALFGYPTDGLQRNTAVGQFFPSAAGGSNQSSGFDAPTVLNPWDYVLMIEGALLFAGAMVKKLESTAGGVLSYPFAVRQSGVGYGSATQQDEADSRAEMWLPLWSRPVSLAELQALMSEGRAQITGRAPRTGVDFARAIATLGVDRGIDAFQRYGFQVRNGLAYFATPLGRFRVRRQTYVALLNPLDEWLDRFIGRAKSKTAPASVGRAARNLEERILALTQSGGRRELQSVLSALGACEAAMAHSYTWASDPKTRTTPVPPLAEEWLHACNDGTVEYRLAAALASISRRFTVDGKSRYMPLRAHTSPINAWERNGRLGLAWVKDPTRNLIWGASSLVANLVAVLERRLLLASRSGDSHYADFARVRASLSDVAAFVECETNDVRLEELLAGLLLVDWPAVERPHLAHEPIELAPDAGYGLLKLCFAGDPVRENAVPIVPAIVHHAANGNDYALTLALRRLRASGLAPAVRALRVRGPRLRRLAASVLLPISRFDIETLCRGVLRPPEHTATHVTQESNP